MFIELIVNNKLHTIGLKLLDPGSVYMIQQDLLPFLKKRKKKKKKRAFCGFHVQSFTVILEPIPNFHMGKEKEKEVLFQYPNLI